jgi:hypothetical protein
MEMRRAYPGRAVDRVAKGGSRWLRRRLPPLILLARLRVGHMMEHARALRMVEGAAELREIEDVAAQEFKPQAPRAL